MADTTKDLAMTTRGDAISVRYPIQASTKVFMGAAVSIDGSGNVGVLTAGERFVGFAINTVDNSSGAAAAAGKDVDIMWRGEVLLAVSSAAAAEEGKAVFCSTDDQTFAYAAQLYQYIGKVVQYDSSGYVWVRMIEPGARNWSTWTSLEDDAEYALTAGEAVVHVHGGGEGGSVAVGAAGACAKIGGSTNFVVADTDAKLCVYDSGSEAKVKNRLAATKTCLITYRGQ